MELVEKIDNYLTEKIDLKGLAKEYKEKLEAESGVIQFQDLGYEFIGKFVDAKMTSIGATEAHLKKLDGWGGSPPKSASVKLKKFGSKYKAFRRMGEKELGKIKQQLEDEY